MSISTKSTVDRRIMLSRQRRAEERLVIAILHASSVLNFVAIIGSAAVWAHQHSRSRFMAIQARQAMMFQIIVAISSMMAFLLFMAGFNVAAFGGLIARSGFGEPALTSALIVAFLLGVAVIIFFLNILPLAGVWAAIRILRGHNYLYPIIGRRVTNWYLQKHGSREASPVAQFSSTSNIDDHDPALIGTTHLSILVGLAPIVAAVQWAGTPHPSSKLTLNLMQAALYQLCMGVVFAVGFCAFFVGGFCAFPVSSILVLMIYLLPIIAAIRAFSGKEFHYPLIGNWLVRYLGLGA